LKWTENSNIERLEFMRRKGWEAEQNEIVLLGQVDKLKFVVRTMAIIDKEDSFSGSVSCSHLGNE